ncbi:helix-turn-helix domain-containing protein [Amycolatopsis taiwanensis]|uniref:helix-turn-helix domain-containing protein n=1 Tax=Amycolatopsis taiwanensis TaxID=342230 RepID=UPI00048686E9|nr:helix-turn-helix domain-containing protein [Amycolatopsis taiwanensis]
MVRDPLLPKLLSVTEAADVLGHNRSYVHQLIKEGSLPAGNAGTTVVLAEATVLRYKAGERFPFPTLLVVHVYDEDADGWTEASRTAVAPDYEMPDAFRLEDIAGVEGRSYRVELLDNQGKTLGMKTVEPTS